MQTTPQVKKSKKHMTQEEIKERDNLRKMNNRLSAERTRQNREKQMENLNTQVEVLKSEITLLRNKLHNSSKVELENEILRSSLKQLSLYLEQQGGSPTVRVLPPPAIIHPYVTNSAAPPPPPMAPPSLVATTSLSPHEHPMHPSAIHLLDEYEMTSLVEYGTHPFNYDPSSYVPISVPGSSASSFPLQPPFVTGHPFTTTTSAPVTSSPHQPPAFSDPPPPALTRAWESLPNPVTTNLLSRPLSYLPTSVSLPNPNHNNNNNSNNNNNYNNINNNNNNHNNNHNNLSSSSSTQPQYPTSPNPSPASSHPPIRTLNVQTDFSATLEWRSNDIVEITRLVDEDGLPPRSKEWADVDDFLPYVDGAFANNRTFSGVLGASYNGSGGGVGGVEYQTTNGNEGVLHVATWSLTPPPSPPRVHEDITRSFSGLLTTKVSLSDISFKAEDAYFHTGGGGGGGGGGGSSNSTAGGSTSTCSVPQYLDVFVDEFDLFGPLIGDNPK